MESRDKTIQTLIESLPGHAEAIERAYAQSGHFRSICADFCSCANALIRWDGMESGEAKTRCEEYRALLEELEEEILRWLEARDGLPNLQHERKPEADQG